MVLRSGVVFFKMDKVEKVFFIKLFFICFFFGCIGFVGFRCLCVRRRVRLGVFDVIGKGVLEDRAFY